jgi:hypothetical protein
MSLAVNFVVAPWTLIPTLIASMSACCCCRICARASSAVSPPSDYAVYKDAVVKHVDVQRPGDFLLI